MLKIAGVVDVGTVRPKNDDRALIGETILDGGELSILFPSDEALIAVSDGVGGNAGGHICAQLVLEQLKASPVPLQSEAIAQRVEEINQAVLAHRKLYPEFSQMAATLVFVAVSGEKIVICNAGDSRAYRLRRRRLMQLTWDHTRSNEIPEAYQLKDHRDHVITRYMGKTDGVQPYISDDAGELFPGDVLLLCSDGLYDGVSEEEMQQMLSSGQAPLEICHALVDKAKKAGQYG